MKKVGILLVLVIFCISFVSASEDVIISHEAIKDKSLPDEEFIFSVSVENPRNVTDVFRFYAPTTYWEWVFRVDPASIRVEPESSREVMLYLTPYDDRDPGNYAVTLELVSNNYSYVSEKTSFNVEVLSYEDVIDVDLKLPSTIKSDEDNLFRVELGKTYDYSIPNLSIKLKSDYFEESAEIGILGDDKIEKEFLVGFDGDIEVGENEIRVLVYREGKLVLEKVETINIGAAGDVQEIGTPESGFLFYKETIERVNNQNAVSYETLNKKLTYFQKLFTEFSEEPTSVVKESNFYTYTWEFSLEPEEGKVIIIETDYRMFVYGLIGAIIIIWLLYLYFKKDLFLTKRVTSVQHSQENISTISVLLILKNKSMRKIRNVKLMDGLANVVEKPSDFGSISPTKIMRSVSGTKMMWDIPVIDPGAEIAISYTAKCKVKIIGKIQIPVALVKYIKSKRRVMVRSNKVRIFG